MVSNHFHPHKKIMFQQLHESEDYYDHFSYSVGESEPVYDVFHEVQAELLHKVHAEFQKMNVSITEDFRSLKATMNHMMEIVKKIKLSGRRSDGGNAPLCAQENLAHKTAPPKSLRAQSSPMGHKPRTSRFKQPVEHKRFNSSKYGSGSCALPSRVKDVLFGTYGKQPFDRGRNGDDEVRLKICINRFDQVVYSLLLAKHSLLHKIFHVYVSEVCIVEDEPLPGRPPPLRDKKSHSPVCSAKEFKPKSITSTTTMRFFIKQACKTCLTRTGSDKLSMFCVQP